MDAPDPLASAFRHHQAGRLAEAIEEYLQLLAQAPRNAQLPYLLGTAYLQAGQAAQAVERLRQSLALAPANADAWNNLGTALRALKRHEEALASLDQALALRPDSAEAQKNRAIVLRELKRAEALAHDRRGLSLKDAGRLDAALASYDAALAVDPGCAEAALHKSLLLLLRGEYEQGWPLFESRFRTEEHRRTYYRFPEPPWRGQEDIRGKRVFIHAEQGLGDFIQFCRYLPLVAQRGAELVVEVPRPLASLAASLACPMTILTGQVDRPAFDTWCPLMSLPLAFRTTLETIPARTPYLFADAAKARAWRDRLGAKTAARVGLAWSGSGQHVNDPKRSMRIEQLRSLLALPGVEWHSLQKEYRPGDAEFLQAHPGIRQHHDEVEDFSDTAALVECLDLVVSVDTSVAHLAGALGKPVWVLLPHLPDHRWLLGRADSPWYPTARLYRQRQPGDWEEVIGRLRGALDDHLVRGGLA